MKTPSMMKSLIAVAAVSAALTGMSANAEMRRPAMGPAPMSRADVHFGNGHFDRGAREVDIRIDSLSARITQGQRARRLSFREATRLSDRLDAISALKRSYERSGRGLDGREVATLNARLDMLSGDIRYQGHDYNRR